MSGVSVTSNVNFVTDGRTSIDISNLSSNCNYGAGESHFGAGGSEYIYAQSAGALTQGAMVGVSGSSILTAVTGAAMGTASATLPIRYGFVQTAFASSQWGFVMVRGAKVLVRVQGSPAPQNVLYTTDTAGELSTTTATASQFQIFGVQMESSVSASGSTASVATANVSFPIARRPHLAV